MSEWTDVLDARRVADEAVKRANDNAGQGYPHTQMDALLAVAAELRALAVALDFSIRADR